MVLRCADDVVDGTEQHARKWEDNLLMDGFTTLLRLNDDVVSSHESNNKIGERRTTRQK